MVIVIANKDISWSVRDREILIQVSQKYYQLVLQITSHLIRKFLYKWHLQALNLLQHLGTDLMTDVDTCCSMPYSLK